MGVPGEYWLVALVMGWVGKMGLRGRRAGGEEGKRRKGKGDVLLCPNFVGSEEAPTTAKYGAVKNARAAASVAISSVGFGSDG